MGPDHDSTVLVRPAVGRHARCGWIDSGPFSHHAPGGITVPAHRYTRALTRRGSRPRTNGAFLHVT